MLEAITLGFVEYGKTVSGIDHVRANTIMQSAAIAVGRFMERYDVILSPTLAAPPLKLGAINLSPDCDFAEWGKRVARFSPFTQMANWTGQPAMSVPLAMSAGGLPLGTLFTGRYGEEAILFRLAAQLERARPWFARTPRLAT